MRVTAEISQSQQSTTDIDDTIVVNVIEMCSSKIGFPFTQSSWLRLVFEDHDIADVTIKLKDGCLLFYQEGTAEVLLANLWEND